MATVYKAIDLVDQRPVALKVLLPHLTADDVVRRRFLREARAGMELDHPGIVKVYEVGEEEDQSYIAMELVEGKTLDVVLEEETLGVQKVIDIGLKVADALAAAHEKGIIHRDIKPRNIMVSDERVKVMDFGLVKITEATSLTMKYEIIGTLHYMSPQQAIGAAIDQRSDIFSLGVVLYQLLTGILPFEGDHPGTIIHSILHSDPLRMEELREGIPVEVEQVVFKALRKKPQERYQNVAELKSDLQRVQEMFRGEPAQLIATDEVFEEQVRGIYSALIGRERELDMLQDRLRRALGGEGSTVLVKGEAGIGKSRLVWELGREAKKAKSRYLVGQCLSGAEGSPYQPILRVIRSYLELKGVKDPDRLRAFIEEKAPHLAGRMGVIETFLLMGEERGPSLISREQLLDTAYELVRVMSRDRPVLLHLEDLHWADPPTLNLLIYLARNIRGESVLIVGTYRPEEMTRHLSVALDKMRREGLYEEIDLERLDKQQTRGVIDSVFPRSDFTETFVTSMYGDTEGNPLFILEMLKLLRNEGRISQEDGGWRLTSDVVRTTIPEKVSDVIMHRLNGLTQEERHFIDVASVEGRSFQSDTLCHCLKFPRIRILRGLQNLEQIHHLIHAKEREYQFDHGKIRDVVYNSMIPELRKEYHRLIGEHFVERFAQKEEYAGTLTYHLLEADQEEEALPYLVRAGEYAKGLFANEEATGYLDRGVDIVERRLQLQPTPHLQRTKLSLLKARVAVKQLTGSYDEAREDSERIRELAQQIGDQQEVAHALVDMGNTFKSKGNLQTALELYELALGIWREIGDRGGEGKSLYSIGVVHFNRDEYELSLRYCDEAMKIQREIGDRVGEAFTLSNIGTVHCSRGDYEQGLRHYEETLRIFRQIGDKRGEAGALNNIGAVHYFRGDYEQALVHCEKALELHRAIGDRANEAGTSTNLGAVQYFRGNYDEALRYYDTALRIQRQIGDRHGVAGSLNNIGKVHHDLGEYDGSLRYYHQSLEIYREIGDRVGEAGTLGNIARVHYERGDLDPALRYSQLSLKIEREIGNRLGEADALCCIAAIHTCRADYRAADYRAALGHQEEALAIHKQIGNKAGEWDAQHFLARVWLEIGGQDRALEVLEEAGRTAQIVGTKSMRAASLIDAALVKHFRGDNEEARIDIEEGLRILRELGIVEAISEALTLAAQIETAQNHDRQAIQYAEELLGLAADKGKPQYIARTHLILARIRLAQGDLDEAESHAGQVLEIAEPRGMRELLWRAHFCVARVLLRRAQHVPAR
ncbi:hypothetical protein AMJ82_11720, partial [candidate division TA06 bacterium SM23_40]